LLGKLLYLIEADADRLVITQIDVARMMGIFKTFLSVDCVLYYPRVLLRPHQNEDVLEPGVVASIKVTHLSQFALQVRVSGRGLISAMSDALDHLRIQQTRNGGGDSARFAMDFHLQG